MWWPRSYGITIQKDGTQRPMMYLGKYDIIKYFFLDDLSKSSNVLQKIQEIKKNLSVKKITHLVKEDKCDLMVEGDNSRVSGYFGEFVPFEIPTSEIIRLMEEWYEFLILYERGKIPGIIPMNKREEWVIVPREQVKESYWDEKEDTD